MATYEVSINRTWPDGKAETFTTVDVLEDARHIVATELNKLGYIWEKSNEWQYGEPGAALGSHVMAVINEMLTDRERLMRWKEWAEKDIAKYQLELDKAKAELEQIEAQLAALD